LRQSLNKGPDIKPAMRDPFSRMLEPELVARLRALELKAREVAEGALTGIHHSSQRGSSLEFSDHRPYTPGDEIKMIDWKLYAKFDRYFIKQFEDETNIRCVLLVDGSTSMAYPEQGSQTEKPGRPKRMSKLEYSQVTAAALAWLLLNQSDAVGLAVFGQGIRNYLPPRAKGSYLQPILKGLAEMTPEPGTSLSISVYDLIERTHGRTLFIFLSDLLDEPDDMLKALKILKHRGHEMILFQILDPDEMQFSFSRLSVFEGMEDLTRLLVDPRAIREEYQRQVQMFLERIKGECMGAHIDYWLINTSTPAEEALSGYLAQRQARKRASIRRRA
jgi:uncharacterized protein (DUF58 family)